MTENTERVLDWVGRFDPASKNFPVRGAAAVPPRIKKRQWTPGKTLDQGREGACVGFGWTHEALSSPTRVDLNRMKAVVPREPTQFASFFYKTAQKNDDWAGENYEGTSVLAGAKTMVQLGLLREYRWAYSVSDVILGLNRGPVVLGTEWREGMYEAPGGALKAVGDVVGGHCYLAIGYDLNGVKELDGQPGVMIQNSWGLDWGINGLAWMTIPDLSSLIKNDGEACVPWIRSYGR